MALDLFLCWLRSSRQLTTQPGGQVSDPHAAFGLVLVLAARPARTHDVDQEVLGADHDVDVLGLGQDGDRRGRRVDPPLRLGFGHALNAVAAAFELEVAKGALTRDAERHFAETAQLGRLHVENLELPAHLLGEPPVHLVQVAGEQGRFVAAGARPGSRRSAPRGRRRPCGRRAGRAAPRLPACWRMPQRFELGLGIRTHLGVGLAGAELLGLRDLPAQLQVAPIGDRDLRQRAPFPGQSGRPARHRR